MPGMASASLTQGMTATLFMAMWVTMMVAMMFPAAAPMILMFAGVHSARRARGQSFVPTAVFVTGYMMVWTVFGVLAYAVALGAAAFASAVPWLSTNAARIGGVTIIAAGLYQLSPLKHACLVGCRTPMRWVFESWRDGYGGALLMGLEHGALCLGCCWLLFVILFPLGVMNVAAMALLTALIYAERSLATGHAIRLAAAVAMVAYGIVVVLVPRVLPTVV